MMWVVQATLANVVFGTARLVCALLGHRWALPHAIKNYRIKYCIRCEASKAWFVSTDGSKNSSKDTAPC